MSWWRACGALLLAALPARGADVWQRARTGAPPGERETQGALYRTLEGTADSVDGLLVRVSMVDVARGKRYADPLTLIYVLRTRRLLGLSSLPGQARLLQELSAARAPREAASLAAIELGRLLRAEGDGAGARAELDHALTLAWRSETRVEALLLRGWLAVAEADVSAARADFRATLDFDLGRKQLALALSSLAWVELLRGDMPEARRLYGRAQELLSRTATISDVKLEDRPELLSTDRAALLELGRRLSTQE